MNYLVVLMVCLKTNSIKNFYHFRSGITMHDIESFIPRMLARFYTDSLMYGNLTKDVSRIHLNFI